MLNAGKRRALMKVKNSAHVAALYGMLIALAFVLSFVETLIPISLGIPGVKLGLANLVTVVGLYTVGTGGTVVISLLRIVLTGFTFGNLLELKPASNGSLQEKKLDGHNGNQYSWRRGA